MGIDEEENLRNLQEGCRNKTRLFSSAYSVSGSSGESPRDFAVLSPDSSQFAILGGAAADADGGAKGLRGFLDSASVRKISFCFFLLCLFCNFLSSCAFVCVCVFCVCVLCVQATTGREQLKLVVLPSALELER